MNATEHPGVEIRKLRERVAALEELVAELADRTDVVITLVEQVTRQLQDHSHEEHRGG